MSKRKSRQCDFVNGVMNSYIYLQYRYNTILYEFIIYFIVTTFGSFMVLIDIFVN